MRRCSRWQATHLSTHHGRGCGHGVGQSFIGGVRCGCWDREVGILILELVANKLPGDLDPGLFPASLAPVAVSGDAIHVPH